MNKTLPLILLSLLQALPASCSELQSFAETNEVELVFEGTPSETEAQALQQDLLRCLVPSRPFLKTTPLEDGENGETLLVGLWTPEPSLSGLTLPNSGQLRNGVFQIPISASFLAQVRAAQTNLVSLPTETRIRRPFPKSCWPVIRNSPALGHRPSAGEFRLNEVRRARRRPSPEPRSAIAFSAALW